MTELARRSEKTRALRQALDAFEGAQFGQLNATREALMQAAAALGWNIMRDGDSWPWARKFLGRG